MSIENLIITLSGINRKSIDVNLSLELKDVSFKILDKDNNLVISRTVTNSLDLSPQNYTLLCGDVPPAEGTQEYNDLKTELTTKDYYLDGRTINEKDVLYYFESLNLFNFDEEYTLITFVAGVEVRTNKFFVTPHPAMLAPKVIPIGNRLLKICFPYPVKNLDVYDNIPGHGADTQGLLNFYINFFDADENRSNKDIPQWTGYIVTKASNDADDTKLAAPYLPLVSSDYRTMLVQATAKSFPLGIHNLKVATSKNSNQLGIFLLRDFHSEKGREIPVSEIPFEATGGEYSAIPTSLDIVGQNKVIVTFNDAVCIPQASKLTVENLSTVFVPFSFANGAEAVTRVPETLNMLEFTFNKDKFFPLGELKFHMDYIKDKYGLDTPPTEFTKIVTPINPTLVSVVQDDTSPGTAMIVEFSAPMIESEAKNALNYKLTKLNDELEIELGAIELVADTAYTKFKVNVASELSSGTYTLAVEGIHDVYGVLMTPGSKDVNILDTSVPTVVQILGTTNDAALIDSILIQFNESMAIDEVFGLDRLANYKVDGVDLSNALTAKFMDNKWARINFMTSFDLVAGTTEVSIGHIALREVFYVKNASGNVFPLCTPETVDTLVPALDLANSTAAITAQDEITLNLTGPNDYFDPALFNKDDFKLTSSDLNEDATPIEATLQADLKTVVFKFDLTFTALNTGMKIVVANVPTSEDILNRKLVGMAETPEISNNLRPVLVSASTINISSDAGGVKEEITVALVFSSSIDMFAAKDFTAVTGSGEILKVDETKSKIADDDSTVVEVVFWAFNPSKPITTDLLVSSMSEDYIKTSSAGKRIIPFTNVSTVELYSKTLTVEFANDGTDHLLSNGVITLEFDKPIVDLTDATAKTGTLTTAKSLDFNGLQILLETDQAIGADESFDYTVEVVGNTIKYIIAASATSKLAMANLKLATASPIGTVIRGTDGSILNSFLLSKYFF